MGHIVVDHNALSEIKDGLSQTAMSVDNLSEKGSDTSYNEYSENTAAFSETASQDGTIWLTSELDYITSALFDLVPILDSTMDIILARRRDQLSVIHQSPLAIYINRIRQRYPNADSQLIERLAIGTLESYVRINSDQPQLDPQLDLELHIQPKNIVAEPMSRAPENKTKFHDSGLASTFEINPNIDKIDSGKRGVKRKSEQVPHLAMVELEHRSIRSIKRSAREKAPSQRSATIYSAMLPDLETLGCDHIKPPPIPIFETIDGFTCPICKKFERIGTKDIWE